ncbi:MAG TPA: hypothetical protein VN798_14305, partial [Pseudomonas sp.]|nr:hypothetical protein [Pseudomonas sp.]
GQAQPGELFVTVRHELVARFGGMTAFTRTPAQGVWEASERNKRQDDLIIYEVMVEQVERSWWQTYKQMLERRFAQDELVIRFSEVQLI